MGKRRNEGSRLTVVLAVVAVLLCAAILFAGGYLLMERRSEAKPEETPVSSVAAEVHTLSGSVEDASMNVLDVKSEDGKVYSFSLQGVAINTEENGILVGDPVVVSYEGELDENKDVQDVKIVSLLVNDREVVVEEPVVTATPEPTPVAMSRTDEILNGMSLEEKVGQMFIARVPETDAAAMVSQYQPGGYIMFERDFAGKTKDTVIAEVNSYQANAKVGMFIGVDEEGGIVNRISTNPNLRGAPFWSPQALYSEGGFELIESDTEEKCDLLHSLGINLNFAPVADVSTNANDFMYYRSFGRSASETSQYVSLVVSTMKNNNMGSVLKHFPGYGNNADTHTGMAYDNRSLESFRSSDFLPFKAGIEAGASMVLVSHNVVGCMDGNYPASLSKPVHDILRNELGYTGVIITDDLVMNGIRDFTGDSEAAVLAVQAGNDLLCCTDFVTQIPAVIEAVRSGEISEERINESVRRILDLKLGLGIIS